jgi:5-methylthioadenosine/S-adenosylhomocysteine deaminase
VIPPSLFFGAGCVLLVRGGTLVDGFSVIKADMLIENGKIRKIGKGIKEKAERTIDASGKIVIPGLVNAHTHLPMTMLRNYAEGKPLERWLKEDVWPAEAKMTENDMCLGGYMGVAECLLSGTTCAADMFFFGSHAVGAAADSLNMRLVQFMDIMDSGKESDFGKCGAFISKVRKHKMSKPGIACHSVSRCGKELLVEGKGLARKENLAFQMHVAETRTELFECIKAHGKRPVEYAESLGLLDRQTLLAHASWVTKREIGIIAKSGAAVAHCPISNLKLATGGIMPLEQYREAGACIALGTDGASSNNSLDMIETMKMAGLLQKHRYWDAAAGNPKDLLTYATYGGAKALGLDAGRIAEGCLADLVILDPMENMVPLGDVYTAIAYSCSRKNVETVIVGGKVSVENGKLLNFDAKTRERFLERADAIRSGSS